MNARSQRRTTGSAAIAALVVAVLALILPACSDGSSGNKPGPLGVVSVEGIAEDDTVPRNRFLEVTFDDRVDRDTVSATAFAVRMGTEIVPGRIEIADDDRSIRWYAVVLPGDSNDYFPQTSPPINGIGLPAFADLRLEILADVERGVLSRRGEPLESTFTVAFRTTDAFLPEDPPIAPGLAADPLGIDPAPIQFGNPMSLDPADWPLLDPVDPVFTIRFDEALDPATVLAMSTVSIVNVSDPAIPVSGVGEMALVRAELTPDARSITIDPILSLGDDPNSSEPFAFEIRLDAGIRDLAGNALAPTGFGFRTADTPGEPNYSIITETFDDDSMNQDDSTAIWGGGELAARPVSSRTVDYLPMLPRGVGTPPPNVYKLAHPLVERTNPSTPNGCRFQMQFHATDIPHDPEYIVGMSWGPKSNFVFDSGYRGLVMKLGVRVLNPPELSFVYEDNFDLSVPGNPATVFEGDYYVRNALDREWEPWPDFQDCILWESNRNLMLDVRIPDNGDTFQLFRNDSTRSFPRNRIFSNADDDRGRNGRENTQYEHRFELVRSISRALSKGYEAPALAPDYEAYLVVSDPSRTGTSIDVRFAGTSVGDEPRVEQFDPDIDVADSREAIAFLIDLVGNPMTGVVPRVDSIHIAVRDLTE